MSYNYSVDVSVYCGHMSTVTDSPEKSSPYGLSGDSRAYVTFILLSIRSSSAALCFEFPLACVARADLCSSALCNSLTLGGFALLSLSHSHCLAGAKPLNSYTS